MSLAACEATIRPAPAAGSDGSVLCPVGCPEPRDGGRATRDAGGSDAGVRDAGPGDGGAGDFCAPLPRAGNAITAPAGFAPTRVVARWDRASCASPALIVALTEGDCELATGERVVLRFNEANVTDARILPGINVLFADGSHPLQLTYVRPDMPSLAVGPCTTGTVEMDMLALTRGGRLVARFDATLDDCGLVGDSGVSLVGTLDVPIAEGSAEACP